MDTVRDFLQQKLPMQGASYSIYRGAEDEEELHIEEPSGNPNNSHGRKKTSRLSPTLQKYIIGIVLVAFVAFILGFVATRRPCASCDYNTAELSQDKDPYESWDQQDPTNMDWNDLRDLLRKYLRDGQMINDVIRMVSEGPHAAGSEEDRALAQMVLEKLKTFYLDHTWVESHFAELPFPDRKRPSFLEVTVNGTTKESIEMGDSDVYCPYSTEGDVSGGLLYAQYGRREDFQRLAELGLDPKEQLVIVRTGFISFAQKVANAEAAGAAGVLIYPESPNDFAVYGHVHLGTGDPNSPGFPSFNHTQFPPMKSAGLPKIPAQPISSETARKLFRKLIGVQYPSFSNADSIFSKFKNPKLNLRLVVKNVKRSVELINVFGSLTGLVEPEHYIVVGAQRDSLGPGAAKSAVGTAILLELARTISMMVHNGFKPRRSLLFVSWDAGDFGSIGATEWLEGYLSMLHLKAAAYVSVDSAVLGDERFIARTSPLFKSLIKNIIKQVENPRRSQQNIYENAVSKNKMWETEDLQPLLMDTSAFAFTAFGGVPAVELSFAEMEQPYQYLDSRSDNYNNLNDVVGGRLAAVSLSMAEVVGLILIKLSHDHILPLDYSAYNNELLQHVIDLNQYSSKFQEQGLTLQWLSSARGDYTRATQTLRKALSLSDLSNEKLIQSFNVRIMRVEFYFLSQYASATEFPYRHILIGRGEHTFQALIDHLKNSPENINVGLLRKQLALFTWTVKGAANALSGEVWEIQRSF
ncbi:transferrin receptor protein 2 isoform X2 [Xenopus laevis]|uniref:Transferrin receptor protein 2 isoform X2 n=1 Tax=Xenopus laevis TaxID=8355 RepID=A0A8J0UX70_XENLA|nr:transferrin receptor protein 2 isoform X2 [Xenopus laevis]